MTLEDLQQDIRRLDVELVNCLDRRFQLARRLAALKREGGLPPPDLGQAEAFLTELPGWSDGSTPPASLERFWRLLLSDTLALEEEALSDLAEGNLLPPTTRAKRRFPARIRENIHLGPELVWLRLTFSHPPYFQPGQFFQLGLAPNQTDPFLARPFAPVAHFPDGLAFVFTRTGRGTRFLANLPPGTELGLLAPLGNSYRLEGQENTAVLLGGGVGGPSLAPLAAALCSRKVETILFLGARDSRRLPDRGLFPTDLEVHYATDDGSRGFSGHLPAALAAWRQGAGKGRSFRLYACGPLPLLKAVAAFARLEGIDCQVSMEERMACGLGACAGCAVPLGGNYQRVCREGPVFMAGQVEWDKL
ncbi:MAG: chorismate mutase [Planctomycetota bacterium]|jgi:dihydroorotate dehydrogenase electron transfer subunit|nr:chorismate mutase [Planctomycetota bacterium]